MSNPSIQDALATAMQHQQAGRLREAEGIYRQILLAQPNHPDAMHLLGIIAFQSGRLKEAAELICRAIAGNPGAAEYHSNLGLVLTTGGRFDDAIASYRQAVMLNANSPEIHNNLADAFCSARRFDEAITHAQRAISLRSNYPQALNTLGIALLARNQPDDAIAALRRAVTLDPRLARAWFSLGIALQRKNQNADAIAALEQATIHQPDMAQAHHALGLALHAIGRSELAIVAYRRALAIQSGSAEAHNDLGVALHVTNQFEAAAAEFEQALAIRGDFVEALYNLGSAYHDLGRLEEAIATHRRVLELYPPYYKAYNNLGTALREIGAIDQAIDALRQAIAREPDWALAHHNLALTLLLKGDFAQGLPEQEWRMRITEIATNRQNFPQPQWDGSELGDRRLLLHTEQGFGDAIQFVRYVPMAARLGGQVLLQCQRELFRLFQTVEGVSELISRDDPLPEFDVQCALMSLPLLTKTTMETIPAAVPYLRADEELSSRWRKRLPEGTPKIGLVWVGRASHRNQRNRSIPLPTLAPLAEFKGVTFISLQKRSADSSFIPDPSSFPLSDWTDELRDFADTAALIANLDLVISVDTAVAHLAGAMGKLVWLLLPHIPDWRWFLSREDSPWYPTMRLFRQPQIGDWATPVAEIVRALQSLKMPPR